MNLGAAAGAGVAGHIHMHVLPRWVADANFMTVVAETRILPEILETTWMRLRGEFRGKSTVIRNGLSENGKPMDGSTSKHNQNSQGRKKASRKR
jgi:diadenosine tetraphosphate (Ap4A) HIT family hydrolase